MRTVLHKSNVYEMNDSSMDIDFGFYVPIANDDNSYNGFFCNVSRDGTKIFIAS